MTDAESLLFQQVLDALQSLGIVTGQDAATRARLDLSNVTDAKLKARTDGYGYLKSAAAVDLSNVPSKALLAALAAVGVLPSSTSTTTTTPSGGTGSASSSLQTESGQTLTTEDGTPIAA